MPFNFASYLPPPAAGPGAFPQPGQLAQRAQQNQQVLGQPKPLPQVAAPKVDAAPIWNQQQIEQQKNTNFANSEAKFKGFQQAQQKQLAGRGLSANSQAAQRQAGQQYMLGVGQANALNTQTDWNAAQGNAAHVLEAQGKAGELANQSEAQNSARQIAGLQAGMQTQKTAADLAGQEGGWQQQSALSGQEFGQAGTLAQGQYENELNKLTMQLDMAKQQLASQEKLGLGDQNLRKYIADTEDARQKLLATQSQTWQSGERQGAEQFTGAQNEQQRQLQAYLAQQQAQADMARQYMAGIQSYQNQGLQSQAQLLAARMAGQTSMYNNQLNAAAQLQDRQLQNQYGAQMAQFQAANQLPFQQAQTMLDFQRNQIAAQQYNPQLLQWDARNKLRGQLMGLTGQVFPTLANDPGNAGAALNNLMAAMNRNAWNQLPGPQVQQAQQAQNFPGVGGIGGWG